MTDQLLDYRKTLHKNSEIFLLNFREEFRTFGFTCNYIDRFIRVVSKDHMITGKTLISFVPYLSIIQRQYHSAFQAFSVFQSYNGWVLLRPAIESALIMGKWLDDRDNLEVWKKHEEDWRKYSNIYSGKNLVSVSLPDSSSIQSVLKIINDLFMHANPSYYHRHTELNQVDENNFFLKVAWFDDQKDHENHLYAFLHVTALILNKVGQMLIPLYKNTSPFLVDLEGLQKNFRDKVAELAKTDELNYKTLSELGLWPNNLLQWTAT